MKYIGYCYLGFALLMLTLGRPFATPLIGFGYLGFFGFRIGRVLFDRPPLMQAVLGLFAMLAAQSTLLSIIYWFFDFTPLAMGLAVIAPPVFLAAGRNRLQEFTTTMSASWKKEYLYVAAALFGYVALLGRLLMKRTGDSLSSPWILTGEVYYTIVIAVFAYTLWLLRKNLGKVPMLVLAIAHSALLYGVFLLLVKHGYGFDPFIHQASIAHILEHGAITPKQPFYIGQYMLTLLLQNITGFSLHLIDTALTPVLAALMLPTLLMHRYWREKTVSFSALFLVGFIPLPFLTVTTPHNLALLTGLTAVLLGKSQKGWLPLLFAAWTAVIHPLVGIPVGLTVLAMHTGAVRASRAIRVAWMSAITISVPMVLFLNGLRSGAGLAFQNPIAGLHNVLRIFTVPEWYLIHQAPVHWQQLYLYKLAIMPLLIVGLLAWGVWIAYKKHPQQTAFMLQSAAAIALSGFLLGTTLQFPGVISYEQGGYAHRLLTLAFFLLVPYSLYSLSALWEILKRQHVAWLLPVTLLLFISWHFTYPTRDRVSWYNGYGVRDADIEVAEFIASRHEDTNYVVLSNQSSAAAALKAFGFYHYHDTAEGKQFIYSIPTGGPLYTYFGKMVYQDQKREWMVEAMDFAGVDTAYFVHTNYWAPAAEIRDNAKKEADQWWELAGGRVWVYEYTR